MFLSFFSQGNIVMILYNSKIPNFFLLFVRLEIVSTWKQTNT